MVFEHYIKMTLIFVAKKDKLDKSQAEVFQVKGATTPYFKMFSAPCKTDLQREGNHEILVW